jgi:hypothetical protein
MLRITLEREIFYDLICNRNQVIEEMTMLCTGTKGGMIRLKGNDEEGCADENGEPQIEPRAQTGVCVNRLCIHLSYRSRPNCVKLALISSFSLADT